MKKIKINFAITTVILFICLIFIHNSSLRFGNTLFNMSDKKYDDYGAGSIKYPTSLDGKTGIFDITNFKVKLNKDKLYFEYQLSNIDNEYDEKNGFSHVLIDTYISVGEDGIMTTLEHGAAVTFNENYPWVYHIRITPEYYYIEKVIDIPSKEVEKVDCKLEVIGNKIRIITDKTNINENLKQSKYYVFTGGYDIFGSDNYRRVIQEEDEWSFYNGIKSLYQPNIIDVVSPLQERMLSYFVPPVYAVLSPIYNQTHQLIFKKELVYALTIMFFGYEYYILYKRYSVEKIKQNKKEDE